MSLYEKTVYHGTLNEVANKIMQDTFIVKEVEGRIDDHWLGHGIYFYEDKKHAQWWGECEVKRKKKRGKRNPRYSVIEVLISVDQSLVCDLDKTDDLDKFFYFCESFDILETAIDFTRGIKRDSKYFKEQVEKRKRCFLLDCYKNKKDIEVISYTFSKKNPTYGKYRSQLGIDYKEKQICATSGKVIKKKNICLEEEAVK